MLSKFTLICLFRWRKFAHIEPSAFYVPESTESRTENNLKRPSLDISSYSNAQSYNINSSYSLITTSLSFPEVTEQILQNNRSKMATAPLVRQKAVHDTIDEISETSRGCN